MGYLFLAIALAAGMTNGYCGKMTSGYTATFRDAMQANLIRMGLCIVIGLFVIFVQGAADYLLPTGKLLAICALSGAANAMFVATWLICVRKSAYMMLDVFLMLGIAVPLFLGKLLFSEDILPLQWLGLAVLLCAVLLMCSYNNSIKEKLTLPALLLLLLCGTMSGTADFSQKLFVKVLPDVPVSVFNFYTYIFAALTLGGAFLLSGRHADDTPKPQLGKISIYIAIMALCLFLNTFFKTMAARHLDGILLYPLLQGGSLILASLMSAVLFREKLTGKAIAGIVSALSALIIINVLA